MRAMRIIILFIVFGLCASMQMHAQVFSKLPEKQRNEQLTKIARNVYHSAALKKYYTEYGESGKVEISSYNIKSEKAACNLTGNKKYGHLQYIVKIYSQPNEKRDYSFPIANVYISDTAGKAWQIKMGNDNMYYDRSNTAEAFK